MYVPLVRRFLECKSTEMTLTQKAENLRREKRLIEYNIMTPQAALGNTSAVQIRNRHETTRTGSNDRNVRSKIDRAISASSTQVLTSQNASDFSLLDHSTSSSTARRKRHLSSFLKETDSFSKDEDRLSSVVTNCVQSLEKVVKQFPMGNVTDNANMAIKDNVAMQITQSGCQLWN